MNTKNWIDLIVKETETALTILYSYIAFNKLLSDPKLVEKINNNPEFWMVHVGALQHTLFLCLGRLSDSNSDCRSFSRFNSHCMANVMDFSEESFRLRRSEVFKINPDYLDGKQFPSKDDLSKLFALARRHCKYLKSGCRDIRSKVFAHAIYTEDYEYDHLFKQVDLKNIEDALLTQWSISQHLWQAYQNARTITPSILTYSEKEDIFDRTYRVVLGE